MHAFCTLPTRTWMPLQLPSVSQSPACYLKVFIDLMCKLGIAHTKLDQTSIHVHMNLKKILYTQRVSQRYNTVNSLLFAAFYFHKILWQNTDTDARYSSTNLFTSFYINDVHVHVRDTFVVLYITVKQSSLQILQNKTPVNKRLLQ